MFLGTGAIRMQGRRRASNAGTAYRYVRLTVTQTSNANGFLWLGEWEVRNGGTDLLTGGTGSYTMTAGYRAYDNSITTWAGNTSDQRNTYVKYDLGSGNEAVFQDYRIYASSTQGNYPKSWTLEASNNDSDWDTLDTRSGVTWSDASWKTYTL